MVKVLMYLVLVVTLASYIYGDMYSERMIGNYSELINRPVVEDIKE